MANEVAQQSSTYLAMKVVHNLITTLCTLCKVLLFLKRSVGPSLVKLFVRHDVLALTLPSNNISLVTLFK